MNTFSASTSHWSNPIKGRFLRFAAGGWIPASWFQKEIPPENRRHRKTGDLHIELVSHCWNYSHLLVYQLSSLILFPPRHAKITMTVYYAESDERTRSLLQFIGDQNVPGIIWNWRSLPEPQLFRRAIGRNQAALATQADWIWFTDCDLMFRENCLDSLVECLQGRTDTLVYPRVERCTSLLADDDPMLRKGRDDWHVVDVDTQQFEESVKKRATGPLQITHGDVARACGYCQALSYYQQPSDTWCKAYEDRAFRWLLRTQGVPIDIPGVYRIRHVFKGRYTGSSINTKVRTGLRLLQS